MTTATGGPGWDPELDGKVEGHFSQTVSRLEDGTYKVVAADGMCESKEAVLQVLLDQVTDETSPAWVPGYDDVRPKKG